MRAVPGGRHLGEGTRNALIGLGPGIYLELIGTDLHQPPPTHPRWFGLDGLTIPRLVAWAVKTDHVDQRAAAARAAGLELGQVRSGRRETSEGQVLSWRFTYPNMDIGGGLVPFLIDWGASPHPSLAAPRGVRLVGLRAYHPDPPAIAGLLERLGVDLPVGDGPTAGLIATLDTPRGRVEL